MAAVTPLERQCELVRYYPAASVVEAATSQSRWDVRGNAGDSVQKTEYWKGKFNIKRKIYEQQIVSKIK